MSPNSHERRPTAAERCGRRRTALAATCLLGSVALAATSARAAIEDDVPAVQTESGAVIGKPMGSTVQFLGIPYAAPPTGALRFRPPQPRAPWSAPLQATTFG